VQLNCGAPELIRISDQQTQAIGIFRASIPSSPGASSNDWRIRATAFNQTFIRSQSFLEPV
jgi:hypothetical protein